jgi:hypothetical protein
MENGYNYCIIRLRVSTTGIVEVRFEVKKRIFNVFDVGGQASVFHILFPSRYFKQMFSGRNGRSGSIALMLAFVI